MKGVLRRNQDRLKNAKPFILVSIIMVFFIVSLFFQKTQKIQDIQIPEKIQFDDELTVSVDNTVKLKTDIAQTSNERAIGLSKYSQLQPDQAMLFVFKSPGLYSFWMRDMKFPIDIIWLNEDKEIVSIKKNVDPLDFPESYHPSSKALYVLETVAGFSQKNNLVIGQKLFW